MTLLTDQQKVLVLRSPGDEGNRRFWVADLPDDEARRWEQRLATTACAAQPPEIGSAFGDPLTLPEAMEKLQSRDFRVIDYPVRH